MLHFLGRLIWVFFPFIRLYSVHWITLYLTTLLLIFLLYLQYVYQSYLKYYFYEPLIKYLSYFATPKFILFILFIFFFIHILITLIVPYFKVKKEFDLRTTSKSQEFLSYSNATFLKKKAILDLIKFRKKNNEEFDKRYKPEPYGLLPSSSNFLYKKNFIIRNVQYYSKIKWVKYFFDLEYASYFRGIFNWWFLSLHNLFKFFNTIVISFFFFSFSFWFMDSLFFQGTRIRKLGLFLNAFTSASHSMFLLKGLLFSIFLVLIYHYFDYTRHYSSSIFYRELKADFKSEWAEIILTYFSSVFLIGTLFRPTRFHFSRRRKLFFKKFMRIRRYIKKSRVRLILDKTSSTSGFWQLKKYLYKGYLNGWILVDKWLKYIGFNGLINYIFKTDFSLIKILPSFLFKNLKRRRSRYIIYEKPYLKKKRKKTTPRRKRRRVWRKMRWVSNMDSTRLQDFLNLYNDVSLSEDKLYYMKKIIARLSTVTRRKKRRRRRYLKKLKKRWRRKRKRKKRKAKIKIKKKKYAFNIARSESNLNFNNLVVHKKKKFFIKDFLQKFYKFKKKKKFAP